MKLWFVSRERFEDERQARRDADIAASKARQNVEVLLNDQRLVLRAEHAQEIDRLHASYARMFETFGKVVMFGTANPPAAEVVDREQSAEERVARMVSADTLRNAADWLEENYRQLGIPVTRADVEGEAKALLVGGEFVPSESLRSFVREGLTVPTS